jgi:tRNA pseudouridine55 synthase
MDGLLLVDKPAGQTSHDVVARLRRVLGERRIGHTGTLDPAATGLLPLVVGRATRLARFLSAADKTYEADLQLGVSTDSGDAQGRRIGALHTGPLPLCADVERALEAFRGSYLQRPPALSAKRIGGRRSYDLARQSRMSDDASPLDQSRPAAAPVTVTGLDLVAYRPPDVRLIVTCSAGFYVRSLAEDLGQRLGTGAHLTALRRTRTGTLALDQAIGLAEAEEHPARAAAALIPMPKMMPDWLTAVLTPDGVRHARDGRDLGPADFRDGAVTGACLSPASPVRLMNAAGDLVGIAVPAATPGLLHPSVVLM